MSVASPWQVGIVGQNTELFRLIHDFNFRPAHWVHPERMAGIRHADIAQNLLQAGAPQESLQQWMSQQLGLHQLPQHWDFAEPRLRLSLLSHETLAKLALYCGAARCWQRISSVIGGTALKEIKQAIGPEAHLFALRKGRMIMEGHDRVPLAGDSLAQDVHALGWTMILQIFHGEPDALVTRFKLKLPLNLPAVSPMPAAEVESQREVAWQRTRRVMGDVLERRELRCFV